MCHHREFDREWVFEPEDVAEPDDAEEEEDGPLAADEREVEVDLLTDGGEE